MTRAASPRRQGAPVWTAPTFDVPEQPLHLTTQGRALALQIIAPLCQCLPEELQRGEHSVARALLAALQDGATLHFVARLNLRLHACRLQQLLSARNVTHPLTADLHALISAVTSWWTAGTSVEQILPLRPEAGRSDQETSVFSCCDALGTQPLVVRHQPQTSRAQRNHAACVSFKLRGTDQSLKTCQGVGTQAFPDQLYPLAVVQAR